MEAAEAGQILDGLKEWLTDRMERYDGFLQELRTQQEDSEARQSSTLTRILDLQKSNEELQRQRNERTDREIMELRQQISLWTFQMTGRLSGDAPLPAGHVQPEEASFQVPPELCSTGAPGGRVAVENYPSIAQILEEDRSTLETSRLGFLAPDAMPMGRDEAFAHRGAPNNLPAESDIRVTQVQTARLPPQQPRFEGISDNLGGGTGSGGSRLSRDMNHLKLKVDHFDGKVVLEDYLLQFEMVAKARGWDASEQAIMLASSLRGDALAVLSEIPLAKRENLVELVRALRSRFGREFQQGLSHLNLRNRRQMPKEEIGAYSLEIRRLTRLAFRDCPEAARDKIALGQFVDGLLDLELQDLVRLTRPCSMEQAVYAALDYEAARKANRASRNVSRAALVGEEEASSGPSAETQGEVPSDRGSEVSTPAKNRKRGNWNRRRGGSGSGTSGGGGAAPTRQPESSGQGSGNTGGGGQGGTRPTPATESNSGAPLCRGTRVGPQNGVAVNYSARGLVVSGRVNNVACDIVVDTGANYTLIGRRIYEAMTPQPPIRPVRWVLTTATGQSSPILGELEVTLTLEGCIHHVTVFVADIVDDCVLGLMFLRQQVARLDLKSMKLIFSGKDRERTIEEDGIVRLCTSEAVILAPRSETLIEMIGRRPFTEGMINPSGAVDRWPILVARAVVSPKEGKTLVRVLNVLEEELTVPEGAWLADLEPIATVLGAELPEEAIAETSQLPEHLRELFVHSAQALTEDQAETVKELLRRHSDVFSKAPWDIGRTQLAEHAIDTGDSAPIKQPPRRFPIAKASEMESLVEDMLRQGVIEPSTSPWASPVVLVKKKDGSTRFCVDYRRLNSVTKKDSFPLPRIDDTLDALRGSSWFSVLDLCSGYWQCAMRPADKEKTAFTTGRGLYQWVVMSFGLCNAVATFERLMSAALAGLQWDTCLVYLDDIIVPSKTFEEGVRRLDLVLQKLRAANLKASPRKCKFFQRQVEYLGHVVSGAGIHAAPSKLEAVSNWPVPGTKTHVRQFLGLCSYYRRFVPRFADIARPLHRLTEKSVRFQWTRECQDSFDILKQALTRAPILSYPRDDGEYVLDCDASAVGVGAVLQQVQDGTERVIAYYSQALSGAERNYCATRRELLAVVKGISHFHHFLYGRHFLVRSDHAALRWLLTMKSPEGQLARWLERLGQYDFELKHRAGRVHDNADALSRRPCAEIDCKHCDRVDERDGWSESTAESAPLRRISVSPDLMTSMARHTDEDEVLKEVKEWIEKGERPEWETISGRTHLLKRYWGLFASLSVEQGVLCYRWEAGRPGNSKRLWVLPGSMVPTVLGALHCTPSGGHFGISRTLDRLKERFYVIGGRAAVEKFCRECDICAARKGPGRRIVAPLSTRISGEPFERVASDILGPFPVTPRGNRYIVVFMDYFTKWPEATAIPDQTAETVSRAFIDLVVSRYGVPNEFHSDQGRNYESEVFRRVLEVLGAHKTRTTPLHPQSDGMVERLNRTLLDFLAKMVDNQQSDWDLLLPLFLLAYRSAVHRSTGHSPAHMVLGRNLRLPLDLVCGKPPEDGPELSFVENLRQTMNEIHREGRERLQISSRVAKDYYDRSQHLLTFAPGQSVWLYNPLRKVGRSPKLQSDWDGPYLVSEKINEAVYRIRKNARGRPRIVHVNRLAPYRGVNAGRDGQN